jgi:hypothetical protein
VSELTRAALSRATLARQMLLAREKVAPLAAVERLAALQSQLARPPYVALWARVAGFRAEDLTRLAKARKVVRATMMRGTLHLLSARDYLAWRPLLQPMLTTVMQAALKERAAGLDLEGLMRTARACLDERACTFDDLRPRLKKAWPRIDERALGYAVRTHLPLVQVPEDTRWGWPAASTFAVAESWLSARFATAEDLAPLVRRYLAAFGPATVADAQSWLGLRALKDAFAALRPQLTVLRDERGRELFDLPQAPRPPGTTQAPARFLPDFDNLLLGHAERARVIDEAHRPRVITKNLRIPPTFLVDGFVRGTWSVKRTKSVATLLAEPFEPLPKPARAELEAEGKALLAFLEPDAPRAQVAFS